MLGDVIVTNNEDENDVLEVANVPADAEVNVYDAPTGGNRIGQMVGGQIPGPVTIPFTNGSLWSDATVYLAMKETGKQESPRVAVPVLSLSPTSTLNLIQISWSNALDFSDIEIYLNDVQKADTGNINYYEFNGLAQGTSYSIRVELRDPDVDGPQIIIRAMVPTQNEL
ncbi:hypothetical protein [Brevibacillus centrosporus]|uniref:hypothetical protein n=1 Tax=Brevibacillus centrosporus TaxID=54910 RepID=UPI002E2520B4|nr:hypothetical protein [Brevibacillus centrosporus]